MANILYGVNGEGAGHSTRAKEVITHLQRQGHAVHVVSFDRGLANLRKDFEVTEITGWHIEYVNNEVRYRRTIAKNLLTAGKTAASIARLKDLIDEKKIDAGIKRAYQTFGTDFNSFFATVIAEIVRRHESQAAHQDTRFLKARETRP